MLRYVVQRWPVKGVFGNIGIIILFAFIVMSLFGSHIEPYKPIEIDVGHPLAGPSATHLFGTNQLGEDELSRVIGAAGVALQVAFEAVSVALILGVVSGVVAGFWAGWVDFTVSRVTDFLFALPEMLLAILVILVLGNGPTTAAIAIGIVYSPRFARISRSATLDVVHSDYISAARLSGLSSYEIVRSHVIRNIVPPIIVMCALSLSAAEAIYAGLSFLGFGVSPPAPDYGRMLADSTSYMITAPWLVIFPSLALVVIVIAFNQIGDGLRRYLDPRVG